MQFAQSTVSEVRRAVLDWYYNWEWFDLTLMSDVRASELETIKRLGAIDINTTQPCKL